jgi:hypothetical protein
MPRRIFAPMALQECFALDLIARTIPMDSVESATPLTRSTGTETRPRGRQLSLDNKKDTLIRQLLALSRAGKIAWSRSAEPGTFQSVFEQYTVQILALPPNGIDLLVRIFDGHGKIIEEISDREMAEATGGFYFQTMYELYTLAHHSALSANRALDALLSLLDTSLPHRDR